MHEHHAFRRRRMHRRMRRAARHYGGHMPGPLGIRRPLRFLAHKLDLTEDQMAAVAEILEDLRTERAQADVDRDRARKRYAAALKGSDFDANEAREAARMRVAATERAQAALVTALEVLHGQLEPDQRRRFAMLLRTGPLDL